jgi:hypothetical protein
MLQLNVSSATNYNAVYPDVPATAGTNQVLLEFTQSYDYSTKDNVIANLINTVGPLNPWLVLSLTGSTLPTASGQYDVNIWQFTQGVGLTTWGAQATLWVNTSNTWAGTGNIVKTQLLSTERAFISGSNGVNTTTYLLPANGGTYTTYNYP